MLLVYRRKCLAPKRAEEDFHVKATGEGGAREEVPFLKKERRSLLADSRRFYSRSAGDDYRYWLRFFDGEHEHAAESRGGSYAVGVVADLRYQRQ